MMIKTYFSRTQTCADAMQVSTHDHAGWLQSQFAHPVEPLEGWGILIEKFHSQYRYDITKVRIGCSGYDIS